MMCLCLTKITAVNTLFFLSCESKHFWLQQLPDLLDMEKMTDYKYASVEYVKSQHMNKPVFC